MSANVPSTGSATAHRLRIDRYARHGVPQRRTHRDQGCARAGSRNNGSSVRRLAAGDEERVGVQQQHVGIAAGQGQRDAIGRRGGGEHYLQTRRLRRLKRCDGIDHNGRGRRCVRADLDPEARCLCDALRSCRNCDRE